MLINFAVLLTVLIGLCALALDGGMLQWQKIQLQNAADAAALGAAYEMVHNNTDYQAAAVAEAGQNGYVNGQNGVTVTAVSPPTSGVYNGNLTAVQVRVSKSVPSVFHGGSTTVTAAATGSIPPCVYMMNTTGNPTTLTVTNGTNVTINCAAYDGYNGYTDSSIRASFDALYVAGPVGASTFNGTVVSGSRGYYPTFGITPMTDPLSYVTAPGPNPYQFQCDHNNYVISNGQRMSPGVYCNGITINSGVGTVNMDSGAYVVTGPVNIGSGVTLNGTQVMFFLTQGANGNGSYGQFSVNGGGNTTLNLTAPTVAGTYPCGRYYLVSVPAGIIIFGDRNWVSPDGSKQDVKFNGATLNMDGIVYLTNTGMVFQNGTLNSPTYFGLVVDNFNLSGASFTINGNFSGVAGGNPYRPGVGLSE